MKCETSFLVLFLIVKYCRAQFYQDDYHIVHDRVNVENLNTSHLKSLQVVVFKYNDTLEMKTINISMVALEEIKENFMMNLRIYKYVADDYRLLPIAITLDLCEEYAKMGSQNLIGLKTAIEMSNFRGCPMSVKKHYHLENWIIEEEKAPPHLPPGKYSLKIHSYTGDVFLFDISWFGQLVAKSGGKKIRRRH